MAQPVSPVASMSPPSRCSVRRPRGDPRHPLRVARPGRDQLANVLRPGLGVHHRRDAGWRGLGERPGASGNRDRAHDRRADPDRDMERLRWVLLGAIGQAQRRIVVKTPYFLPDATLVPRLSALAAMRGVTVDVVMPARSNLPYVDWAAWPRLGEMVDAGCRLWRVPGAFDHGKVMSVDGAWVADRLGQLGPAQPASQFRARRGVLRQGVRDVDRGHGRPQSAGCDPRDAGAACPPSPADAPARRCRTAVSPYL